jgi:hypothetical protein
MLAVVSWRYRSFALWQVGHSNILPRKTGHCRGVLPKKKKVKESYFLLIILQQRSGVTRISSRITSDPRAVICATLRRSVLCWNSLWGSIIDHHSSKCLRLGMRRPLFCPAAFTNLPTNGIHSMSWALQRVLLKPPATLMVMVMDSKNAENGYTGLMITQTINCLEITNKMWPCIRIYYSNVSYCST